MNGLDIYMETVKWKQVRRWMEAADELCIEYTVKTKAIPQNNLYGVAELYAGWEFCLHIGEGEAGKEVSEEATK